MILCLGSNLSHAQKFDIKKLSTNEGLPSGQIGDVVQDEKGFIWLSTYSGLIRYDGTDTKALTVENGLRNDLIYDLFIDSRKRFWVSTQETGVGLLRSDSIHYPTELSDLDSLSITHINESPDGRVWFSTYGSGVFIWDDENLIQLTEEEGLPSNTAWNIRFDGEGDTWIATWGGVGIFDGENFNVINEDNGLSGFAAYSFAEEENGTIWISTSSGITKFDGENWSQIYSINGKELGYIYDVHVDNEGMIWIATERDGIYWLKNGEYTHITKSNGLSSNYIYSFHEYREGVVWVATDENGVNIFRNKEIRIFETLDYVSAKSINVLHQSEGEFWVGTEAGLTKFDEAGNSVHLTLPDIITPYKEVWDIDRLPNGNLLILNSNSKLIEYNGDTFIDFGATIDLPWLAVHDILLKENQIWLATESGLVKFEDDEFRHFTTDDGLADNFTWSLFEDSKGAIWAANDKGISKITEQAVLSYKTEDGIGDASVKLITQSPDGYYWIGTDEGFSKLVIDENDELQTATNFKLAEEFLQETQFLQFDANGNLWQGTSGGIHFFTSNTLKETKEGVIDGYFLPLRDFGKGVEMNFLASLTDENGNIWFGSYTNGLIKYEGKNTPVLDAPPTVFLKAINVNGEETELSSIMTNGLKHNENNISVEFGAFQYKDPDRVFYEYRLIGFEGDWNRIYRRNEINYTNLAAGMYDLELRAKSIQSEWGNAVTLVSFKIQKPFWSTWWFYTLAGLVFTMLMYLKIKFVLIYYEKNNLNEMVKKKTSDLEKALEDKEILIKEIHHRVKNNMAVISGLLDLQGWHMPDGEAKMAIENSKLRLQTIASIHEKLYQNENLKNIDFKAFTEDLVEKIEGSLKGSDKNVNVKLDFTHIYLTANEAIPCGLILNELISNCYEHAFEGLSEGNIRITFKKYVGNRYCLIVKDDGIGISEEVIMQKRNSLGITLINSLASQIKAEVQFMNEEGTKVKVTLPRPD